MHPQLVAELRSFKPKDAKPVHRVLPEVPDMDVLKLDLKAAGIDYGNKEIGFADLHAQRKTLNMLSASHGVKPRSRQAQLRYTDPRLTEGTYWDDVLFVQPHAEEVKKAAAIPTSMPLLGLNESTESGFLRAGNSRLNGALGVTGWHRRKRECRGFGGVAGGGGYLISG